MTERQRAGTGTGRAVSTVAAAWILSLGVDLLLHGGLLARLYSEPSPFLLDANDAFRRIPFGYLTFLILTTALFWLIKRLGIRGPVAGFRYGAAAGAVVWGAMVIGLYSISTASVALLVGWWVGQTLELALAAAVIGAAAAGRPIGRLWTLVIAIVLACIALTVTLQSIGWAPVESIPTSVGEHPRELDELDRTAGRNATEHGYPEAIVETEVPTMSPSPEGRFIA